jgi:hypothetical protein
MLSYLWEARELPQLFILKIEKILNDIVINRKDPIVLYLEITNDGWDATPKSNDKLP